MALQWRQLHDPAGGLTWGQLYDAGGISIDAVSSATPNAGDTLTLTLSNASATGKTVTLNGEAVTPDSQNATSLVLTVPDLFDFGSPAVTRYGQSIVVEVTDGVETATTNITIGAPTGDTFVAVAGYTEVIGGGSSLFNPPSGQPSNGIVNGDEAYLEVLTGAVTIDAEGVPTVTALPCSVNLYIYDSSAGDWSASSSNPIDFQEGTDEDAPVTSNLQVTDIKPTTVDVSIDTTEDNGTVYLYISTSATPPDAASDNAALKAGTGAVASANQAVSATGTQTFNDVGALVQNTSYYAHTLHEDSAGNDSTVRSSDQFTTQAIDTTPDQWTLNNIVDAIPSTPNLASNVISITGIDANQTITLAFSGDASARWRRNGGAWTLVSDTAESVAELDDTFEFDLDASASFESSVSLTVTHAASGITDTFTVTTAVQPVIVSASIAAAVLSVVSNKPLVVGVGGSTGLVLTASGGALTATLLVAGLVTTYTLSRTPAVDEVITLSYTNPGDGLEDALGIDVPNVAGLSALLSALQHRRGNVEHLDSNDEHNQTDKRHNRLTMASNA